MQAMKMGEELLHDRKYYFEGSIDEAGAEENSSSSNVAQNKDSCYKKEEEECQIAYKA